MSKKERNEQQNQINIVAQPQILNFVSKKLILVIKKCMQELKNNALEAKKNYIVIESALSREWALPVQDEERLKKLTKMYIKARRELIYAYSEYNRCVNLIQNPPGTKLLTKLRNKRNKKASNEV